MAEASEFHINKEYQDLITPLTTQGYDSLKTSIKENGQEIPIIVSDRTGQLVITDGLHRYKIRIISRERNKEQGTYNYGF